MGAAVLSSCGAGSNGGNGSTPAPTGGASTGGAAEGLTRVELGAPRPGVIYPEGYQGPLATELEKFYDGDQTFRVVVKQDENVIGDWNDSDYTAWLEEQTGVKVEFDAQLQTDSDMTRINAMLAGGDLPDGFLGMPFTQDQISLYGSQGLFIPLDEYIEALAPNMRMMMEQYPDFKAQMTSLDGHIYQFAGINDCYHCRVGGGRAWVNKKYVEAVGGKIPTTTDELRELLLAFKEEDPSGTGNMIPFTAGVTNFIDNYIMNAFLYNPGQHGAGSAKGAWFRLDNGNVDFVANKPEWREALRYLRQLNLDGTLDRGAFTLTDDELRTAGNQGRIGFARAYWWGNFIDIGSEDDAPWRDYVTVGPLAGPDGTRYSQWDYTTPAHRPFVITRDCEDPATLVRWADSQMEMESMLRGSAGVKDGNWRYAEEGELGINGNQAVWRRAEYPPPFGETWNQASILYNASDFRLGQVTEAELPDLEMLLYQATIAYEEAAPPREWQLPLLTFDQDSSAQRADIEVGITNHVNQATARFTVGELDVDNDRDWEDYVNAFEQIGVGRLRDLYQSTYENRPQ